MVAVAVGLVIGGLRERPSEAELAAGASATRLTTVSSNRYEYWRVGLRAFADHPLAGLGAGGFRVAWLQERTIPEAVRDAHSLEVEIAAELGLVGLMAFGLLAGGVAAAARGALRTRPEAAAGPAAALLAWFLHASIDWDWQLPGGDAARGGPGGRAARARGGQRAAAPSGSSRRRAVATRRATARSSRGATWESRAHALRLSGSRRSTSSSSAIAVRVSPARAGPRRG